MSWATLSASTNRVAFDRLGSVSVVAGAVTGRGFLRQNSEMLVGDQVISIDYALTCEAALFGSLAYNAAVIVNSQSFVVQHEPMQVEDGTLCVVPLSRVTTP